MKKILIVLCCALGLLRLGDVHAENIRLEDVVVTATRTEKDVNKISSNITVITQDDIKRSTATIVQDLLRNEAGLVIRDLYGVGTKSTVDMRGFGRGLNTVILIDGRRVNEIDLSGVDWNLIPLENVERIEILRGSGSVLYGDNAISGVINIITKKGRVMKPEAEIGVREESFNSNTEHFTLRGATNRLGYFILAKHSETDGYRNNSKFIGNDLTTSFRTDLTHTINLELSGGYHKDRQGYPGALTESQMKSDRRQSITPNDGADYEQYFYGINAGFAIGNMSELDLAGNFNNREFDADFGGGNIKRDTRTQELKLKLKSSRSLFNRRNLLVGGIDRYSSDVYSRSVFSAWGIDDSSNMDKTEMGYYLLEEFYINDQWSLSGGYRYTHTKFDNVVTGTSAGEGEQSFDENALKAGVNYNYAEGSKGFVSYSQGFRLPTTDELFAFDGTLVNLKPERAKTYEAGIVQPLNANIETRLTFYKMDVKNELIYNPIGGSFGFGANENLDDTEHKGIEFGLSAALTGYLSLKCNWTYTDATFESGSNNGKTVPLIPEQSATLGATFSFPANVLLVLNGNWVGERFLENDLSNTADKLEDYVIVDARLSYQYKKAAVYLGVNNIFDEKYSEYGVIGSSGTKNFYPAPEIQYHGGIKFML